MEITINTRQVIALIWTLIAIVISLIVVFGMGFPATTLTGTIFAGTPWWFMIVAFFGVFLVITLPVYLLLALWGLAVRPEAESE
jgi:hypothetical protein